VTIAIAVESSSALVDHEENTSLPRVSQLSRSARPDQPRYPCGRQCCIQGRTPGIVMRHLTMLKIAVLLRYLHNEQVYWPKQAER